MHDSSKTGTYQHLTVHQVDTTHVTLHGWANPLDQLKAHRGLSVHSWASDTRQLQGLVVGQIKMPSKLPVSNTFDQALHLSRLHWR